jgi:hypothetical protein
LLVVGMCVSTFWPTITPSVTRPHSIVRTRRV